MKIAKVNKMKKYICYFSILLFATFISCNSGKKTPPVRLDEEEDSAICVSYSEKFGVKTIPVKLNGVSMDMIYDTGCSGLHLSLHELGTMYKNGKFSDNDLVGFVPSQIADGSIVENGVVIIRNIEIDGDGGKMVINKPIKATVTLNQQAPVLLGNGVIDEMASVEVDNVNKTINFTKKSSK